MPNQRVIEMMNRKIKNFREDYSEAAKGLFFDPDKKTGLIHTGEFGMYRELMLQDFLRPITPNYLSFGTGYVISRDGGISGQTDIIIYDSTITPFLEPITGIRFFPVESVAGVIEVKSNLDSSQLEDALKNLLLIKEMRSKVSDTIYYRNSLSPLMLTNPENNQDSINAEIRKIPFLPSHNPYDQIYTLIVCNKFTIKIGKAFDVQNSLYARQNVDNHMKNNLVLSIQEGLLGYRNQTKGTAIDMPIMPNFAINPAYIMPKQGGNDHISLFAQMYARSIANVNILFPDMVNYIEQHQMDVNFGDS